ncbi:GAF domain-containing serine/threonine-protein kinase [Amnibacterium sp. CER49]|uniref:serine/threonine-protein kinase n=1 Tax=Amnibacterium sp. CER49 TaxID=3039161 RepID=UPI002447E0CD|nr:GAF domain-containing serine/threonine-protein kinase [Amnibacterium sp. CER49]MDH2444466.1 GAF domain-containing serine/threonine-protein kinase [Amnibacterium sp. CER49]
MAAPDAPVPQRVLQGRYRLRSVLGSGGKAVVYRAMDELLGREVAVKVFTARAVDAAEIRQQEAEARLLASLSMHGLVMLLDAGVDLTADGTPQVFLVMELVEGHDLKELLRSGSLTLRQVAHFGFDLTDALQYVHEHGVVHRDVKPANVLLLDYGADRRPRVKLADFGIAALGVGQEGDDLRTGTAAYLSPEQVAGEPVGPPSDVYSLGLVLLECITGRMEYPGEPAAAARERLVRAPEIPADLPPEWRGVLAGMLARRPEDRPALPDLVLAFRQLVVEETARHRPGRPARQGDGERADALRAYGVLGTPPDDAFDRITALAARIVETPLAAIAFPDGDALWFKSRIGLASPAVPRGALASLALDDAGPTVVEDAAADPRTADDPLVTGPDRVRFFAAVPLTTPDRVRIGMLCVLDVWPRTLEPDARDSLVDLAAVVMHEMELRRAARRAALEGG